MRGSIRPKDMCTAPTARSVAVSGCPRWWRVASPRRTTQHHSAEFTADGTQFGADGTQFGADTRSVFRERAIYRKFCPCTINDAAPHATRAVRRAPLRRQRGGGWLSALHTRQRLGWRGVCLSACAPPLALLLAWPPTRTTIDTHTQWSASRTRAGRRCRPRTSR
jgi:hypothetical protein